VSGLFIKKKKIPQLRKKKTTQKTPNLLQILWDHTISLTPIKRDGLHVQDTKVPYVGNLIA